MHATEGGFLCSTYEPYPKIKLKELLRIFIS